MVRALAVVRRIASPARVAALPWMLLAGVAGAHWSSLQAAVTVPNTFANGAVADALQVNANFTALTTAATLQEKSLVPVGTVVASMLSEAQFGTVIPDATRWALADGRSVAGSTYATITGSSTVPDLRGVFLRGKNNGRADAKQNPDGELALGAYQADDFKSHQHGLSSFGNVTLMNAGSSLGTYIQSGSSNTAATGGVETRARNVTINYFIKIN